jgi:hypothetical protein
VEVGGGVKYTVTDNPAIASRYFVEDRAEDVGASYCMNRRNVCFRTEPGDGAPGIVVRIFAANGDPVEDRIGWLREKRITSRRKVAKEEEE